MTEKTQGHGYFRKKKWAKGLVSGIAVAGIVAFSAGSVLADEAVQPESKNDNNTYAKQAGKATGSQPVAIDNSAVTKAASTAKQAGVVVSETSSIDKGTDTTSSNLEQSKGEIKQDQDKQIKALEETTAKQVENNTAFKEAQEAIQANNSFVATEKGKHETSTTVTVTNDGSTATDGTADKNKQATKTAKKVLEENQQAVSTYLGEKAKYDATVEQATALNKAVESVSEQLKKEKVDVKVVTRTVSSVAEVEALKKQNDQAIATAKGKVELNKALMAAYTEKKNASDQVNQDADRKSADLKKSGVLLTSKTQEVSSVDEANKIAKQNQTAFDKAKQNQAEWQKKYNELQSKTSTEGFTKEVVLQALSLATANPEATVESSASGAQVTTKDYIASSNGTSGYTRVLDSTKVLKYKDVGNGWTTENDFKQIDFGNSYQSNLVTVEVPNVKPEKHVLDQKDNKKVLDGQEVQIGQYIRYLLDGVTVPTKHDSLFQYDGSDQLDLVHDRYTGNWSGIIRGSEYVAEKDLVLPYDVTIKNGQIIKAGDRIPKGSIYAFQFEFDQSTNSDFIKKIVKVTWNEQEGKWSYTIDKEFLNSLGVKGTFDTDFYLEVERIAAGKVENTFINTVNLQEMTAKVTTTTPEPPKPEEPGKPNPQPSLPNTGSVASMLPVVGMILGLLSLAGLRKSKEN